MKQRLSDPSSCNEGLPFGSVEAKRGTWTSISICSDDTTLLLPNGGSVRGEQPK